MIGIAACPDILFSISSKIPCGINIGTFAMLEYPHHVVDKPVVVFTMVHPEIGVMIVAGGHVVVLHVPK